MICILKKMLSYFLFKILSLFRLVPFIEKTLRKTVHLNPASTLKWYCFFSIDSSFKKYLEASLLENVDSIRYDDFFLNELESNIRSAFVFYNYILNYRRYFNPQEILDKYFIYHGIYSVLRKNELLPLYVDNLKVNADYENHTPTLKKVSVILTVYNEETLVLNALKSISNQTYSNFNIIIVDDASTDKTISILSEFKENSNIDIKIVRLKENQGTYVCKNIGMLLSDGDLLAFHDADDWSHPQKLEKHVLLHSASENPVATISRHVRIKENGRFFSSKIYPLDRMCMISLVLDRKVFNELGFFRSRRFGCDTEYYSRIINISSFDVVNLKYVLTFCAHRKNSLTTGDDFGVQEFGQNDARIRFTKQWNRQHSLIQKSNKKLYVSFDVTKYNYQIICSQ